MEPRATTTTFFKSTITAFFLRQKPLSTSENPACMKNTRKAHKSTQMLSRTACMPAACAWSVNPA